MQVVEQRMVCPEVGRAGEAPALSSAGAEGDTGPSSVLVGEVNK